MDKQIKRMYENQLSGPVIASKLNVSLKKVYRSLLDQGVVRRSRSEQNKLRLLNCKPSFNIKTNLSKTESNVLIGAAMLYLAEGAKTQRTVDFANSDPYAVSLFLRFLRDICRIDENRVRFYLYCFESQNVEALKSFWAERLKAHITSFTKPYIRKNTKNNSRIMPYGVLHVRYSDKKLLQYILDLTIRLKVELS